MRTTIQVQGAREHNLKNVDVEIPRNQLTVITGVSGSGKSSLAFDTIYAEGQRCLPASMSSYAKRFVSQLKKPEVDFVNGLSPVVSIDQKTIGSNPRSTVGTLTDIQRLLDSLNRLVDAGHSVIVIEHNLDVIRTADYIIDLGPEGGHGGGEILAVGPPEAIAKNKKSHTGRFLREILKPIPKTAVSR